MYYSLEVTCTTLVFSTIYVKLYLRKVILAELLKHTWLQPSERGGDTPAP